MYNVMIVEDEKFARDHTVNYLKKNLGDEYGVFSAESGEQALEIFEDNKIDIVVTDIKMPGISGLQLAQLIHEKYPQTLVIILSGYAEFDYAREAICHNAKLYLLKPFAMRELKNHILNLTNEIRKRSRGNVFDNIGTIADEREMFFVKLVYGGLNDMHLIESQISDLYLPFDVKTTPCDIVAVKIENYDGFINSKRGYTKDSFQTVINNLISGCLERDYTFCIYSDNGYFEYLIYHFSKEIPDYKMLADKMNAILKLPVSIFKRGETFDSVEKLIDYGTYNKNISSKAILLIENLKENKDEDAKAILETVSQQADGEKALKQLVSEVKQYLKNDNIEYSSDIGELQKNLANVVKFCAGDYTESIENAKRYIQRNYSKNISREDIAKAAYFSPAYFARTFKLYTGESFSDYLLKIRMEKAIELMKQNKYKIYEIAEKVGYENTKYFFRVFKLYSGYSPKDYMTKVLGRAYVEDE